MVSARHPSLGRRLSWLLALSVVGALALAVVGVSLGVARLTEVLLVTRLVHDRDTLVAGLDQDDPAGARLALIYQQPLSGHYFQIQGAGLSVRSRSLWDQELNLPALEPGESWRGHRTGPRGQSLLMLATGVARGSATVVVGVAEDTGPVRAVANRIYGAMALAGILAVGLALLLQHRLLRRLLGPVERLRRDALALEAGRLQRLDPAGSPREVLPLVDALNRVLEAAAARLARSRRAVGDLAHALKTPLAALAQLRREPPLGDHPELDRRLQAQLSRLQTLVDGELRRARLAGRAPGAGTPVGPALEDMLETLRHIHAEGCPQVSLSLPENLDFPGDREDLLELLGVVLDNAFAWARSRVAVRLSQDDGFRLEVDDDGPGVDPERVAELTRRGRRLDESRPGSGLGLAIAADLVEQYGGSLAFLPRGRLGGLGVRVRVPVGGEEGKDWGLGTGD